MASSEDMVRRTRLDASEDRPADPASTSPPGATPPAAWSRVDPVTRPEVLHRPGNGVPRTLGYAAPDGPAAASGRAPDQDIGGVLLPQATEPLEVPLDATDTHPSLYFNRELSWLDFNWRVLYQVLDERVPLLERMRFLAITENNLDEFVMKRIGGLKRQQGAGVLTPSLDGRTPAEQLKPIRDGVRAMRLRLADAWESDLRGRVEEKAGLVIRDFDSLDDEELEIVGHEFRERIYPILTPLAVDPGHPFPFLSNLSLSLGVILVHPDRKTRHFARVKIPIRDRWIWLPSPGHVVAVEQVVRGFVDELFRGMRVESASLFRVTRNAEVERDEEVADDLLKMISEELRERKFAQVVRLELEPSTPDEMREMLTRELRLEAEDVYEIPGLLDMSGFWTLSAAGPMDLRYPPWDPMIPAQLLREGETEDLPDIFAAVRTRDMLVHHPYESFGATVQRFIEEAAVDPKVVAIKQTLYRTSENSAIIKALVKAAERGKQVAVLVEVTARFDEADNMEWAEVLEEAGVHVTYGVVGLKTHAKVVLVLRKEEQGLRTYCHIGTGNYHSETAHIYADLGIFTARPDIGRDAVNLFHYLTGYAPEQQYEKLIVAPRDLRRQILNRIDREIEHASEGRGGRIIFKMNGLDDPAVIRALYGASRAGVEIDLIVRGLCRLRPGVPGWSENIRVRSIVGRFLEHDRIYWYGNAGEPEVWIGSADCRRRNLDDRVEVMLPVESRKVLKRLRRLLRHALRDNRNAWDLEASGRYVPASVREGERTVDYHQRMMRTVRKTRKKVDSPWDIEPVR
ncbi:MAG: polyphosphate kinase 1 [Gemmatimonadota bacterium]|nr:polyphosphate kinase 1 [Gemmatimonadota bacterium]